MRYRTNDGELIEAHNPRQLVDELRKCWSVETDELKFMEEIAQRVFMQKSERISTTSPNTFADDLIRAGLVTEVNDEERQD